MAQFPRGVYVHVVLVRGWVTNNRPRLVGEVPLNHGLKSAQVNELRAKIRREFHATGRYVHPNRVAEIIRAMKFAEALTR